MGFLVLGDGGNGFVSIFMDNVVCDFSFFFLFFFLKYTRFTEWFFRFLFFI